MSHNSKYYVKKINSKTKASNRKISSFFTSVSVDEQVQVDATAEKEKSESVQTEAGPSTSVSISSTIGSDTHKIQKEINAANDYVDDSQTDNSEGDNDTDEGENDSKSQCFSDDSKQLVPDSRLFTPVKYEKRFQWLYFSAAKGGVLL